MSIAKEIQRIQTAKSDLKTAIEYRGGVISDSMTLDEYCKVLVSRPYAVKGTFTPEEDTRSFSITGLPFKPKLIYMYCHDLYSNLVPNSIYCFGKGENTQGVAGIANTSGSFSASTIKYNSEVENWSDTGYEINFPSTFAVFKAGYTYDYYIAGGY